MTSGTKLTFEQACSYFEGSGLELIEFINCKTNVTVKCYCGNIFYTKIYSIKNKLTTSCGCKGRGGANFKNLSGSTINNWHIDSICNDTLRTNSIYYNCTCICGTIRKVSAKNLQTKKTNGCGCDRIGKNIIPLSGLKIGKLKVLGLSKDQNKKDYYWDCICECGRITSVSGIHLRAENTKSCGHCGNFKNGKRCSFRQELIYNNIKKIFPDLDLELNYKINNIIDGKNRPKAADIYIKDHNIIIEYDEWYWHADKTERDNERNNFYLNNGYKLIVIQASNNLPRKHQLKQDIQKIIDGKIKFKNRKLPGWGKSTIIFNKNNKF